MTYLVHDSEYVLDDDYPVFYDYIYLCDGKPRRSDVYGNVRDLKNDTGAKEVRRCDLKARRLLGETA